MRLEEEVFFEIGRRKFIFEIGRESLLFGIKMSYHLFLLYFGLFALFLGGVEGCASMSVPAGTSKFLSDFGLEFLGLKSRSPKM